MPKLQRKTAGRRPAKTTRATSSSDARPHPSLGEHHAVLTGLTDPFSPEAAQARYPDQGAGATLTFQQRYSIPITSDGNGNYAFAFNPKVDYSFIGQQSMTTGVALWPATFNGASSFTTNLINTYGKSYRPTSMGVRICNVLSSTNSSGYVVIAKGGPLALSSTTTIGPTGFTSWDTHPMQQGAEWHATSHPRGASAYDFKDLSYSSSSSFAGDDTWETIYVAVMGSAVSAAVLFVECYINYEYTAKEDAPIAQLAMRQPTLNIAMQTAVNEVQGNLEGSHKGSTSVVREKLKREAKKALIKHVIPFLAKKGAMMLAA